MTCRSAADRATLGDTVLLDPGTGPDGERRAPRVMPLGRGLAACWNEHARSRGGDVGLRAFGPGFDLDRPAPTHGQPGVGEAVPGADPAASAEPGRR